MGADDCDGVDKRLGPVGTGFMGVVGTGHFLVQPAFRCNVLVHERAQAIEHAFSFGRLFARCDLHVEHIR